MTLAVSEFYWLVGILEGEGYFGYNTTQRVAVSMTDEDTMLRVVDIFEKILGKRCHLRYDAVSERRQAQGIKMAYVCDVYGDNARNIMRLVVPHMSYRRRQKIWQSLNGWHIKKADRLKISDVLDEATIIAMKSRR